jgi:putative ABC transport system permease protein
VSKATALAHSTLSVQDVQALQALPHVVAVSPLGYDGLPLIAGSITSGGWPIEAGFPSLQTLQNLTIASGAFFNDADEANGAAVAAIGPEVATHFFPGVDAVGKDLRIGTVNFRVVGVVSPLGGVPGDNFEDATYLPFSTYQQRLSGHPPVQILAQADQPSTVATVLTATTAALARTHRIAPGDQADYAVQQYGAAADPEAQVLALVSNVMRLAAAVALLASGFGIASTMLLAVRQRTREIGIRLAVGAEPSDVRRQFLIEAATLALAGAVLGMLAGAGVILTLYLRFRGALLGYHFRQAVQAHPLPSPLALLLAASLCVGIGLLFGFLPARRAARLDPIQALRRP